MMELFLLCCRSVCEAVIKTEHLSFDKELTWCKTFQLLLKALGGVDYKVVFIVNINNIHSIHVETYRVKGEY